MKRGLLLALVLLTAGSLFADRAVARWDVVPYQRVKGVFEVGVVAFHERGVKVEFSVNGKKAFVAEKPILNPRTKVVEYVFPFDASKRKTDGLVKIGAKAIVDGEPTYDLPVLELYANDKGGEGSTKCIWVDSAKGNDYSVGDDASPVKTLKQAVSMCGDGGTVYLKKGSYNLGRIGGGKERKYWTTITVAPGLTMKDVKVKGGRTGTDKLRLLNLPLYCEVDVGNDYLIGGEGGKTSIWVDGCRMTNRKGRHAAMVFPFGNKLVAYVTGGATTEMSSGPCCELVRNHVIKSISADAYSASDCLVVNSKVIDIDPGGVVEDPNFHKSLAVDPDWVHDVIMYNVTGTGLNCHVFFGVRLRDSAFVNVSVEPTEDCKFVSRYSFAMENVLFANVKLPGQKWIWNKSTNGYGNFAPKSVRLLGCEIPDMEGYEPTNGTAGLLVDSSAKFVYGE